MSVLPYLSVMVYQAGTINEIRDMSDECIANGITTLYFPDHLIGGGNADARTVHPWLAMVPTLMDIAYRHENITVGTLVASPSLRPAAQLCVEAATISDILGNDRFILSVGAGGAQSDQVHVGESLSADKLAERFHSYIHEIHTYCSGTSEITLRLASPFKVRLASDAFSTIDVVSQYGDAWVTTGGWKKSLNERITKINELYSHIKDSFSGPIAICAASSDGLTIMSTQEEINDYAQLFDCPVNEIILPFSPKR